MHSVTPVKITLPDGVERELRYTCGAQKLIVDHLGCKLKEALDKYDTGAFAVILWSLMHDSNGHPPDVSADWIAFNISPDSSSEIMAAVLSAATQGKTPKNELEALLNKATETANGSGSLATALSASDSAPQNSGGDT